MGLIDRRDDPLSSNDTWVLIACAPRMTHRISKWVSNSTREQWRDKWTARLFNELVPHFRSSGCRIYTEVAKGPIVEITEELLRVGPAEIVDLRRPKESVKADDQPA